MPPTLHAFTHGLTSKWTYLARRIPNLEELFKTFEDAITQQFLPSLTDQNPFNDADQNLMALAVHFGGLVIINPQCTANNSMTEKTTLPLVALILQQSHSYPPEVKAERLKTRTVSVEKGASSWLSTLPIDEHGFALHKGAFRDALCLR